MPETSIKSYWPELLFKFYFYHRYSLGFQAETDTKKCKNYVRSQGEDDEKPVLSKDAPDTNWFTSQKRSIPSLTSWRIF